MDIVVAPVRGTLHQLLAQFPDDKYSVSRDATEASNELEFSHVPFLVVIEPDEPTSAPWAARECWNGARVWRRWLPCPT
jgi:hypothetical protein